jgi:glutaredoxin 2
VFLNFQKMKMLKSHHQEKFMLKSVSVFLLLAAEGFAGVEGFLSEIGAIRLKTVSHPTSWKMSNTLAEAARDPAKVTGAPIPRVYVYDHCPFCVRVRFVLGIKNIKHNVVFLANDDIETPTKLVSMANP